MKKYLLALLMLFSVAGSAVAAPGGLLYSPRGLYVWKGAWYNGGAQTGVTNVSYVVGMSGLYNWNACEATKGTVTINVTNCNIQQDIDWAHTYGKVLAVGIVAGAYVPSWVSTDMQNAGSSAFWTSVFDKSGPPYTCASFTAYDARDPTYQADLEAAISSIISAANSYNQTHYSGSVQIVRIAYPGDGTIGELGSLPWHQGETLTCNGANCTSTCGSNPCTCSSHDDVGSLIALGWTPSSYLSSAVTPIFKNLAGQFPNQVIGGMMTSGAAPCISNAGARTCAAGSFDGTLQPQIVSTIAGLGLSNVGAENDGATATFLWAPITQWMPWFVWTGSQPGSGAGFGYPGVLTHIASALAACVQSDEFYISDLTNAAVTPYLPFYNAALQAGCAAPRQYQMGFF
jgi:hypothetical protein